MIFIHTSSFNYSKMVIEMLCQCCQAECVVVAIADSKRSAYMPNVPMIEEDGYANVYGSCSCGLMTPRNLDSVGTKF